MTTRTTHYELHTQFAMWRKTLADYRTAFQYDYLSEADFRERLSCMGFLPHEIQPEIEYIKGLRIEGELASALNNSNDPGDYNRFST
jgi:hypothetical protein